MPVGPRLDLFDPAADELVAGRRPVEEAFVARREARRLLVVPQRRQALEKLVLHATSLRIPIVEVEGGTLTAIAGFDGHQGIGLVVGPRRYADVDEILARAVERDQPPFVLVLDSLEDPQNVGTLLRSAEAAAIHGVVFPTHRQAPLTPSAVKASAGAVEHLLLAPVDDLPGALVELHGRGLRVVGAEADAPLSVREADLRGPLALVVGSEGQGLGPAVRRRCDLLVRIPMRGAVGSLNASVAGSILLYEASTQRGAAAGSAPAAEDGRPADSGAAAAPDTATMAPESAAAPESRDRPRAEDPSPPEARGPARARRTGRGCDDTGGSRQAGSSSARLGRRPVAARGSAGGCPAPDGSNAVQSEAADREARDRRRRRSAPGRARPRLTLAPATAYHSRAPQGHLRYGPARADVAQLVEQRFCKPPVPGSSPVVGSSANHRVPGAPRRRSVTGHAQWVG